MGYNTYYTMKIDRLKDGDITNIFTKAYDLGISDNWPFYLHDQDKEIFDTYDECKWYSFEEDMIALSKEFPNLIFHLHGEGENAGDLWEEHFMNGKVQYCPAEITIPPFNINELE